MKNIENAMLSIGQKRHALLTDSDLKHAILLAERVRIQYEENEMFEPYEVYDEDLYWYIVDSIEDVTIDDIEDYFADNGGRIYRNDEQGAVSFIEEKGYAKFIDLVKLGYFDSDNKYILVDSYGITSSESEESLRNAYGWCVREWMAVDGCHLLSYELSRLVTYADAVIDLANYVLNHVLHIQIED